MAFVIVIGMLIGLTAACSPVAVQVPENAVTPTPDNTLTPTETAEPTATDTVAPTATEEVLPPPVATPVPADLAAAGVSPAEFAALQQSFDDWWQYWTDLGVFSAEYMPPATPEAGVPVSAVYRIFVDAVTGERMVGVEVLAGNYAGQILTFPMNRENGDATGRPAAEAIADNPAARADWYPLFLSGDIGRHAGYWVRFDENNQVMAYVDPASGTWVEGQLAEALNFHGFDSMPATEAEALANCPVAPDPIKDTQNFLAWRERYRAVIADSLLPVNMVAGGSNGQYSNDSEAIMPEGFSYGCYQFDHEGQGYVMVTIRYPEGAAGFVYDDFLVDPNFPSRTVDDVLSALNGGGSVRLRKITDVLAFYVENGEGMPTGDPTIALAVTEAVPDIHVLVAWSLGE